MIIVQEIKTVWSKYSRSRAQVGLRGQVPTTIRLPELQSELPNQVLYHQCLFSEVDVFQNCNSRSRFVSLKSPIILECTHLEVADSEVEVRYFYNYKAGGAPARTYIDKTGTTVPECKKAFVLIQGQWGCIRHNRRYTLPLGYVGPEGAWHYEQTTVNVGFLKTYDRMFFTSKKPDHAFDKLAQLR